MLGLDAHERFSEAAESAIFMEAMKTSYEEAAKVIPSKSEIAKMTVTNKVLELQIRFLFRVQCRRICRPPAVIPP